MKKLSSLIYHLSSQKGFTLIELMIVIGIFSTLIALTSISLFNAQRQTDINTTIQVFIADLKSQQLRAMVGEEDGVGNVGDYGVHFETTTYTQFRNNYGTSNYVSNLPKTVNILTTFPSSQIIFQKGSGEIANFSEGTNTVTFQDVNSPNQKVVTINKYGVVTSVN